jgi:hypothetical protein
MILWMFDLSILELWRTFVESTTEEILRLVQLFETSVSEV